MSKSSNYPFFNYFRNNHYDVEIPEQPKSNKRRDDMVWLAVFNHIPSALAELFRRCDWTDLKIDFILILLAAIIGLIVFT